jgi:predicted AlkP superfamily pyrophosphatase or phosphodiesterase
MKKLFIILLTLLSLSAAAQKKPALVVGIVVDQMRYEYLYKYFDRYSDKGFKRLMREGINCTDNHYNYAPTVTAAGHASIYTGCRSSCSCAISNFCRVHIFSFEKAKATNIKKYGVENPFQNETIKKKIKSLLNETIED